jgi:hypothetical protein
MGDENRAAIENIGDIDNSSNIFGISSIRGDTMLL